MINVNGFDIEIKSKSNFIKIQPKQKRLEFQVKLVIRHAQDNTLGRQPQNSLDQYTGSISP